MTLQEARAFYDEQLAYYERGDIDGLVDAHYAPDAEFLTLDHVCRGRGEIKPFFRAYLQRLQYLKADLLKMQSTQDTIFFEAVIHSGIGSWRAYDCMVVREGHITHHFAGVMPEAATA